MEIRIELTEKEVEKIIAKEMLVMFPGKFANVSIKSYGVSTVSILDKDPTTEKEPEQPKED